MATPNLGIVHLAAAQNQPEVTVNDFMDSIDDSVNLFATVAMSDADYTFTQLHLASAGAFNMTGTLTVK